MSPQDADVDADENDDEVQAGHHFTYIPPNPKKYYKRLLELCLDRDLAAMHDPNVNDDDQVSLGILSPSYIELINECALRWRIPQTYRAACFLDLIKHLYERNEVPLDCVPEALGGISKVMNEISFDKWNINDVCSLVSTQVAMTLTLCRPNTWSTSTVVLSVLSWRQFTMPWRRCPT